MSAFVCSTDTYDLLAGAIRRLPWFSVSTESGQLTEHDADKAVQILYLQNLVSVATRYPGDTEMLGDPEYTPRPVVDPVDPVVVLKSCDCVEYQSCETDDYYTSLAYKILDALRRAVIAQLPGYERAPWGWERPRAEQAAPATAAGWQPTDPTNPGDVTLAADLRRRDGLTREDWQF